MYIRTTNLALTNKNILYTYEIRKQTKQTSKKDKKKPTRKQITIIFRYIKSMILNVFVRVTVLLVTGKSQILTPTGTPFAFCCLP